MAKWNGDNPILGRQCFLDSDPMKIEKISLTVLDLPGRTSFFSLSPSKEDGRFYWRVQSRGPVENQIHVLHVRTSDGVEGVCTVGDARYSSLRSDELEFMRWLAVGQDALDKRGLRDRLHYATRHAFLSPGWYGALDNCLWDIAGQVADQPVHLLIGSCREQSEAYYNVRSGNLDTALSDADRALQDGFVAIKDHFSQPWQRNAKWLRALRHQTGEGVDLMHDAAGCQYMFEEALAIGKVLEEEGYLWFEEPLPDRSLVELQMLCQALSIPVMALETLMQDLELSRAWLQVRATDLVRANARIGTTSLLDLASFAAPDEHVGRTEWIWGSVWAVARPPNLRHSQHIPATNIFRVAAETHWDRKSACSTLPCRGKGWSRHRQARDGARNGIGTGSGQRQWPSSNV